MSNLPVQVTVGRVYGSGAHCYYTRKCHWYSKSHLWCIAFIHLVLKCSGKSSEASHKQWWKKLNDALFWICFILNRCRTNIFCKLFTSKIYKEYNSIYFPVFTVTSTLLSYNIFQIFQTEFHTQEELDMHQEQNTSLWVLICNFCLWLGFVILVFSQKIGCFGSIFSQNTSFTFSNSTHCYCFFTSAKYMWVSVYL